MRVRRTIQIEKKKIVKTEIYLSAQTEGSQGNGTAHKAGLGDSLLVSRIRKCGKNVADSQTVYTVKPIARGFMLTSFESIPRAT